jgi:hypothetical protein
MTTLPQEFQSGQMTDLPSYPGGNDPTALFEVVSPGNAEEGVNYSITAAEMAVLIGVSAYANTIVTSGASYNSVETDTRILINKTVGSATSVVLLPSEDYGQPILVKDAKGDADVNPITITFSGGELMDGLTQVVIDSPYGFFWFNPLPDGFYGT